MASSIDSALRIQRNSANSPLLLQELQVLLKLSGSTLLYQTDFFNSNRPFFTRLMLML